LQAKGRFTSKIPVLPKNPLDGGDTTAVARSARYFSGLDNRQIMESQPR
jgi:hypothetical protein